MIREIVLYGDPVLREKCRPVTEITQEILSLAEDMVETMREAEGVGLAAPQVGVPIQLAVVDVSESEEPCTFFQVDGQEASLADWMPLRFVNPVVRPAGRRFAVMNEGCLSFPEIRAEIRRPDVVRATLRLLDDRTITVETDGLLSRALQHETDHLNGILFIDRASPAQKVTLKRKIREMLE